MKMGPLALIFMVESLAVLQALIHDEESEYKNITIFTDSLSFLKNIES